MEQNGEHFYELFWDKDNYRIIECQTCGFKHIYPIPTAEELKIFYQQKYYREVKPFPYADFTPERINANIQWLNNHNLYAEIYSKVLELKKTNLTKMLDIGCGNDLLAKYFQNRDWAVNAVEPSKDACEYLGKYDISVYNCLVEQIDQLGFQDLAFVNIQFVLEHLRNPYDVLRKCYNSIAPGGIIRVCVPNDFSEGQMAYMEYSKEQPNWVCLPDHINYFTFNSLSALLAKVGYKEVYRTTVFPLEVLLMGGINYYTNPDRQKRVHPFVTSFEQSLIQTGRKELLDKLYETLAQVGIGRSIFMYAIKTENV